MAGGGVSESNITELVASTGICEVHGSARGPIEWGAMQYRKENVYMGGTKVNDGLEAEYGYKWATAQRTRLFVEGANPKQEEEQR